MQQTEPVGIAGSGRIGQTLGRILIAMGEPVVCVAGRSPERTAAAAAFLGGVSAVRYEELGLRARRWLICVPDDAIEEVAARIGPRQGIALHTCGAKGHEALRAIAGASLGTLHPLQTVPDPATGVEALRGAAFAVSGDAEAVAWAERIVRAAGGMVLRIEDWARPLYHAAAVLASNALTALLDAARTAIEAAGVGPGDSLRALGPLARASLDNALRLGPEAALTGPVRRGDAVTVAAHRNALRGLPEPVGDLYRAAGLHALGLAEKQGVSPFLAAQVRRVLE